MTHVLDLIDRLAKREAEFAQRRFLAPCVPGAKLRVRIDGLVHEVRPNPAGFAGWGVFQAIDAKRAQLVARPEASSIERYLGALDLVRLHLVSQARGRAWWAVPVGAEALRVRYGLTAPVVVHLTRDATQFETVQARFDGANFWYAGPEYLADPVLAETLRDALQTWIEAPRAAHLTPELLHAYALAFGIQAEARAKKLAAEVAERRKTVDGRIEHALHVGGGTLIGHREAHGALQVEWRDRHGHRHISTLRMEQLEVSMAGAVCLQGRDSDFDLTSLVGVLSQAPDYFYD